MQKCIYINGDGGSRGNPGPAASAISVTVNDKEIHRESKFLGVDTNNVAEYSCVLLGLEWVKKNVSDDSINIIFQLDSELVTRQIEGIYKVKSPKLYPYYQKVMLLLSTIPNKVVFTSVPREQNSVADAYVNNELDLQTNK